MVEPPNFWSPGGAVKVQNSINGENTVTKAVMVE